MTDQAKWSRRAVLRSTGGVAGAALLLGDAAITKAHSTAASVKVAASGTAAQPAASTDEARFAYVGTYTRGAPGGWSTLADKISPVGVSVFAIEPGLGDLRHIQTVPSDNPSWVVLHPSGDFLYVSNEIADYGGENAGSVEAYAIDNETGLLTFLNRQPIAPIPAHMSVDPTGAYLVIASYVGAAYEVLPINADGSLDARSEELVQTGAGPHERQTAPHPHAVVFDPAGKFIAGADLGTDLLKIFQLDAGKLTQVSEKMVAPGSGPRHLAFHPNGTVLYVINELTATITAYAYDAESGALGDEIQTVGTVPHNFPSHKSTAEIKVHPSGSFLYGSNRRFEEHGLADAVVAYSIDEATGKLKLIGFTTADIQFPRGFDLDPTGTWLYALNQKGDTIIQYFVEPTTGKLDATGLVTEVMVPVSIAFKM